MPSYILLQWIRLEKWNELTGDPVDSVRSRIKKGEWLADYHYTKRERRILVNYERAQEWLTDPEKSRREALRFVQAKPAAA